MTPAARVTTSAIVAVLALAPWLALLPLAGSAPVITGALMFAAACHGAGLVLARIAGVDHVRPLLAAQWGLAALVVLAGLAIAASVFGAYTQRTLLVALTLVHSYVLLRGFAELRTRIAALAATRSVWVVPALLLACIGVLYILGAAGNITGRPFDDDGHVLGQLQRLRDTGTLGDAIGYPRQAQLGGQLALAALATAGSDVHLARVAEAIAFVLALVLVCTQIGARDAARGVWCALVVITASALTFVAADPATCWTAVGLTVALYAMLAAPAPAPPLPLALTAGALITLRLELAPIAIVAVAAAAWRDRRDRWRIASLAGGIIVAVTPYLIARTLAWSSLPGAVAAVAAPARGSLAVQLGLFAGVALASAPLVVFIKDRSLRWLAIAGACVIAGIASQLLGDRPYAARMLWPFAIAFGLVLVIELAARPRLTAAALLLALVGCVLIQEGRDARGRKRWTRRYLDLAEHAEYVRAAGTVPATRPYALLSRTPAGSTIAVWVTSPERLDYARHRIIDLRTPRIARALPRPVPAATAKLDELASAAGADFLLVDTPGAHASRFPVLATLGSTQLFDLRPTSGR